MNLPRVSLPRIVHQNVESAEPLTIRSNVVCTSASFDTSEREKVSLYPQSFLQGSAFRLAPSCSERRKVP
jgi:hypothetical protein